MPMLDIFNSQAFNVIELTNAINIVPNKYGLLQQMNLFPARGIRTRSVSIERKNGVLNLLPSKNIGAPGTLGTVGKRDLIPVAVPHIPHDDVILAEEVQGVRAFGSETELMGVQDLVNEKLMNMRAKHDITLEFLRWGALNGTILDADGSTLLNLFTTFNVSQETESLALNVSTTDVATKVRTMKRYFELNAKGVIIERIHVFCSPGWFDALVSHPEVEKFYLQWQAAQALSNDPRTAFPFQGVVFEEHNGQATDLAGNVRKFVPANQALAFPIASGVFQTYFAPADFMDTVNTPGLPVYAAQERLDYNKGIKVHTQSNPLPICLRPDLLVNLTIS